MGFSCSQNVNKEVYYKPSGYENKPYIGILINKSNRKYVIPLSSAKEKHKTWKNVDRERYLVYEMAKRSSMGQGDIWVTAEEDDYLLGYHNWKDDWETFGGLREEGEGIRECIVRETEEELGLKNVNFEYLGIVHYNMPPGYWNKEWHEEYGGLYGFVIEKEILEIIEQCRKDKDEIGKIALLSELKRRREKIDEINEALLRYF